MNKTQTPAQKTAQVHVVSLEHRLNSRSEVMSNLDEKLTGTLIEYFFAVAAGYDMFGSENPFVLRAKDHKSLAVGSKKSVRRVSFEAYLAKVPLEMAKNLGATLSVKDDLAVCQIGSVVSTGADYLEATMWALVVHLASADTVDQSAQ